MEMSDTSPNNHPYRKDPHVDLMQTCHFLADVLQKEDGFIWEGNVRLAIYAINEITERLGAMSKFVNDAQMRTISALRSNRALLVQSLLFGHEQNPEHEGYELHTRIIPEHKNRVIIIASFPKKGTEVACSVPFRTVCEGKDEVTTTRIKHALAADTPTGITPPRIASTIQARRY